MKVQALITALILASSTAAMAQPFHISGGVKVSQQVNVRDHRSYDDRIVVHDRGQRVNELERYRIPANYPELTMQPANEWSCIDDSRVDWRAGSQTFDVNRLAGAIRFEGGAPTVTYDAQLIYADGRLGKISFVGSYQNNVAPGVISRIVVTGPRAVRAPQLFVSSVNV